MTVALTANVKTKSGRTHGRFRFLDTNPLTGRPYRVSRFDDLPLFIGAVVERLVGLSPREWDALVRKGEVAEHVDCFREHLVPWTLDVPLQQARTGSAPADVCGDCWGSCVDIDTDGSFTGVVGISFVCGCAR
jgi:hypothetical protein